MQVQAISSIQQINSTNFKGKNIAQAQKIGKKGLTAIKAIPLAALLAMSPLTKTNATEIMGSVPVETTVSAKSTKPKNSTENVIMEKTFEGISKTNPDLNYTIQAVNTKGGADAFDKIIITKTSSDKVVTYDVKNAVNLSIWVIDDSKYVHRGYVKEVLVTQPDGSSSKEEIMYEHELVDYVKELMASSKNQTNMKDIAPVTQYISVCSKEGFEHKSDKYHCYTSDEYNNVNKKRPKSLDSDLGRSTEFTRFHSYSNHKDDISNLQRNYEVVTRKNITLENGDEYKINFIRNSSSSEYFNKVVVEKVYDKEKSPSSWQGIFAGIVETQFDDNSLEGMEPIKTIKFYTSNDDEKKGKCYSVYNNELADELERMILNSPRNAMQHNAKLTQHPHETTKLTEYKKIDLHKDVLLQPRSVFKPKWSEPTTKLVTLKNGRECKIQALNTKIGGWGTYDFDKINISFDDGHTYEVIDSKVNDVGFVSANGMVYSTLSYPQIKTISDENNTKIFVDKKLADAVNEIIQHSGNKSQVKEETHKNYYIYGDKYLDLVASTDSRGSESIYEKILEFIDKNATDDGAYYALAGIKQPTKTILGSQKVEGTYANYDIFFVDEDGNPNNFEKVYVKSEKFAPKRFTGINNLNLYTEGVDGKYSNKIENVGLSDIPFLSDEDDYFIDDPKLAKTLRKLVINSPNNNITPKKPQVTNSEEELDF